MFTTLWLVVIGATGAALAVRRLVRRRAAAARGALRLWDWLAYAALLVGFLGLAVTGFTRTVWNQEGVHGWWLFIHMAAAPIFAVGLTLTTATWAGDSRFNGLWRVAFWAVAVFGLATIGPVLAILLRLVAVEEQPLWIEVHRYAALLLTTAMLAHADQLIGRRKKDKELIEA